MTPQPNGLREILYHDTLTANKPHRVYYWFCNSTFISFKCSAGCQRTFLSAPFLLIELPRFDMINTAWNKTLETANKKKAKAVPHSEAQSILRLSLPHCLFPICTREAGRAPPQLPLGQLQSRACSLAPLTCDAGHPHQCDVSHHEHIEV